MTANTILSDINEIKVGYFLNGKNWYSAEAKMAFESRIKQAKPEEVADAIGKAEVMAVEFLKWAKANGYSEPVVGVWWTARPGELARASKTDADSKKNPTDILAKFSKGPGNGFLGLSAKATKGNGDIGFKNPGVGTVDKSLNINLTAFYKKVEAEVVAKYKLPGTNAQRKPYIRAHPEIKVHTEAAGVKVLSDMRDLLLKRLETMQQKDRLTYLVQYWMDADLLAPPYIKVTGNGSKPPYKASVMDPVSNPKLDALRSYPIKFEKVGNNAIGVAAGSKKIMKIRFKTESEKMASVIKLSGEPW